MAKLAIKKASTDVTVYLFVLDSSKTTGAGLTGLAYNTASLVAYYVRPLGSATQLTLATQTVTGAHSDGGFVEVDATNMPGVYRLDLPDAVCATGVNSVVVMLKGAANMAPVVLEIQLTSYDPNDAVRLGMTALPNAAADAAGGLPISDAGGLDLDALNTNVSSILADTGTDGVKIASGAITAAVIATDAIDADAIKADAITEIQSGLATPTNITAGTITTVTNLTNAPTDMAKESTLTAIKGAGWSDETLTAVMAAIEAISTGSGATPAQIWAYAMRTLTGFTTTEFNMIGPVRNDGKIDAIAGDDYYTADGRGMRWSDTAWPNLSGASVSFISGSTTIPMTVVTAGAGEQTINLDVPRATSLAMKGEFKFIIRATLASTHVVTLLEGEGRFK